jgi:anti-sigma factor RsiW
MRECDLPVEDLVLFAEGETAGARSEFVAAHIASCGVCRERLSRFAQADQVLAGSVPPVERAFEQQRRIVVLDRLMREAQAPAWDWWFVLRAAYRSFPRRLALAVVMLVALAWTPWVEWTRTASAEALDLATDVTASVAESVEAVVDEAQESAP